MTVEEKAKAYDEALEQARFYHGNCPSEPERKKLEGMFPVLCESEDERIKKEIVSALKFANVGGVYDKHIAYLEKQNHDGKKWITPAELNRLKTLRYEAGYKAGFNVGVHSEAEKQKEQKPSPKFKVGDYVIDTNYKGEPLYQIVGIDKECYICEYRGDKEMGNRAVMHFAFNNPYLRLEQKPVEKEITLTSFEGTLNTFLFDFANSHIEDCEPKEYVKKHSAEILKAAYKELNAKLQQDIFEARQEGVRDGYEVAKAEQKPAIMKPHKGDDGNHYDMGVSEAQEYAINRGFGIPFNDGEVFIDERYMTQTIGNILRWADEHPKEQKPVECIEFANEFENQVSHLLASLMNGEWVYDKSFIKHAAQSLMGYAKNELKPTAFNSATINGEPIPTENQSVNIPLTEWSEEDEKCIKDIINCLKYLEMNDTERQYNGDRNVNPRHYADMIAKLKSLRPQPHWKPSDEQMEALRLSFEEAFDDAGDCNRYRILKSLHEHLKNL